jgi:hypothetical protein
MYAMAGDAMHNALATSLMRNAMKDEGKGGHYAKSSFCLSLRRCCTSRHALPVPAGVFFPTLIMVKSDTKTDR